MNPDRHIVPRLVVENGLHQTASSPIPAGETRVGAALDTDIGISDLGAPLGFLIRRTDEAISVRAVGGDIDIGGKLFRPGRERVFDRTTTFMNGGVRFRLEMPPDETSKAASGILPLRIYAKPIAICAACAGLLTLALSPHAASFPNFVGLGGAAMDVTGTIPPASSPIAASPKSEPSSVELLDDLRGQASTAGIETLDFRQQSDGAITAVGTIAPAQETAWHEIGRRFDTKAHGRFILVDDVKMADPAPVLQLQAVWPGRNPYVVDGTGQKLFAGSTLPSGWVIRSIDKSRVLIQRGEQTVAVRF